MIWLNNQIALLLAALLAYAERSALRVGGAVLRTGQPVYGAGLLRSIKAAAQQALTAKDGCSIGIIVVAPSEADTRPQAGVREGNRA